MSDTKPKPFLTLDLSCGCGACLFVEVPQEPSSGYDPNGLTRAVVSLALNWSNAHAAHHKEPKA